MLLNWSDTLQTPYTLIATHNGRNYHIRMRVDEYGHPTGRWSYSTWRNGKVESYTAATMDEAKRRCELKFLGTDATAAQLDLFTCDLPNKERTSETASCIRSLIGAARYCPASGDFIVGINPTRPATHDEIAAYYLGFAMYHNNSGYMDTAAHLPPKKKKGQRRKR